MKDVRGKENTAFTVQYDFCMPDRFELEYTAADGTKKRPIVVHRSSIGAIERVMAFLIERYAGNFPLWLAPTQVVVVPVNDVHNAYAEEVLAELKAKNIRVEFSPADESLGKRIRAEKQMKVPYILVIGDKEVESASVTVESRDAGNQSTVSKNEFVERVEKEMKERTLKTA
jgi:threonyl-tRNA synthetase